MSARRVLLPVALAVAALWPAATPTLAVDPPAPGQCAETMPVGDIQPGDTGYAWTVVRGTEPEPFAVEIRDVLPNGIGPGKDMILFRASDWPGHDFIERFGGIWGGMSGSPVYIDDKLIGAVAFGFSIAPSTLGGITPIGDMKQVGDLEDPVVLSARARRAVNQAAPADLAANDFGHLALPVILPDGPTRGFRSLPAKRRAAMNARFDLEARLEARGLDVIPMETAARPRSARVAAVDPAPGGNFGASLSYGELVAAGIGTTTYVCDGTFLAFGHPFFFTGASNLGAHHANAIDIADDATCCPFKLAVLGALFGRVGQDRATAVAGRTDRVPDVNHLTSTTRRGSNERDGESFIPVRTPPFLAWILPADHAFGQILAIVDAFEDGSVGMSLDVRGHREDGGEFRVRYGDRWIGADRRGEEFFSSADAGGFGTGLMLSWLVENGFEKVTLDRVDVDLDVGNPNRWLIEGIEVSRNGGPRQDGGTVCVRRGDELDVFVALRSSPGQGTQEEVVEIRVPRRFSGLNVRGGRGLPPFLDTSSFENLDAVLAHLRGSTRTDQLLARIVNNGNRQASSHAQLDRVIVGQASVPLARIGSPDCS